MGFSHIDGVLGESAGPSLVTSVAKLSPDEVDALAETIVNWPATTLPQRPGDPRQQPFERVQRHQFLHVCTCLPGEVANGEAITIHAGPSGAY